MVVSNYVNIIAAFLNKTSVVEGLAPLLIRLYLSPVLIQAGYTKWLAFDSTVEWFANVEFGLGLPMPMLMACLVIAAECIGGIFILLGLATRLVAIPLMVTMLVAIFAVHWDNGWAAIADAQSWLSDGTLFFNDTVVSAPEKLIAAKRLLAEHGNYDWLTSSGRFVILNNGIEFAATYFIMLLSLFFSGGGKYTSIDFFVAKQYR